VSGLNSFDKILYVNLAHRADRNERVLSELSKFSIQKEKIIRIDAHYTPLNGHKGCCLSHMKALTYAVNHNLNNVLILEDDVVFEHSLLEVCKYINYFFDNIEAWDVFFLSTRVLAKSETRFSEIFRVTCAQTSHAYAINNHYFKKLYKCYERCYKKMEDDVFFIQSKEYCLDQEWKKLQKKDKWYIGASPIARQGRSVSDIELEVTDKPF